MSRLIITTDNACAAKVVHHPVGDVPTLVTQYTAQLQKAEAAEVDTLYFASIPMQASPSANFQYINMILRTIMNHLRTHEMPRHVCIICDREEAATFYRQVYNFYYPHTKADRMQDESWD